MGNFLCIKSNRTKGNNKREIHGPESCKSNSRCVTVVYPDGNEIQRNIFEHQTAHEFLENCLNEQMKYYQVMLELPLNGQQVLKLEDEFDKYLDALVTIHIIPIGNGINCDPDPSLLGPIQYKTSDTQQ